MTIIDTNTSRADLEFAAIFQANLPLDVIEAATDAELLKMVSDWIEAGDECAGC